MTVALGNVFSWLTSQSFRDSQYKYESCYTTQTRQRAYFIRAILLMIFTRSTLLQHVTWKFSRLRCAFCGNFCRAVPRGESVFVIVPGRLRVSTTRKCSDATASQTVQSNSFDRVAQTRRNDRYLITIIKPAACPISRISGHETINPEHVY